MVAVSEVKIPFPRKTRTGAARHAVTLVEWKGRIPEALAQFIDRLTPWDLEELYGLVGRFAEVRELVNIARRLHQILERGPRTAASGRWSFEEFMATKADLENQIRVLHQRVNAAAEDARLIFPSLPIRKETNHAVGPHRGVA